MTEDEKRLLKEHYGTVLERLEKAVDRAGRKRSEVELVAVSKLHPADMVACAADLGQLDFGENYVQEALEKRVQVENMLPPDMAAKLRWHMIGHVQSRKAPQVAGSFALVHTLDSTKLAQGYERNLARENRVQPVLIEVNVGDESQKSGIGHEDLHKLCDFVTTSCPHLSLEGLMCIPPVFDAGEAARPYFAKLREYREELRAYSGLKLPHLSMGMSGDFEWAVLEGATLVRVGTDIFGARPPKKSL